MNTYETIGIPKDCAMDMEANRGSQPRGNGGSFWKGVSIAMGCALAMMSAVCYRAANTGMVHSVPTDMLFGAHDADTYAPLPNSVKVDDDFVVGKLNPGIIRATTPAFHDVLVKSPSMASYMYNNQIQTESKVSGGVIYTRQHPGGQAKSGFAQVLAATMPKFDARFGEGVSAYWTFQIRLSRKNSGSHWHSYTKNLPTGVQTIKFKAPTRWISQRVTYWSSTTSVKVIVY